MWQVLLAAAVAGSGFFARNFFNPNLHPSSNTTSDQSQQQEQDQNQKEFLEPRGDPTVSPKPQVPNSTLIPISCDVQSFIHEVEEDEGIFRFSSSGSRNESDVRSVSKSVRKKKLGVGTRASKGNVKAEKKISVCMKKRRTAKNASVKCGSSSNKDSSLFGWGVGFGVMYMLSAGKSEISKLNAAMDETAKVVEELKTELHRRKSSRNLQKSGAVSQADTTPKKFEGKHTGPALLRSISEKRDLSDTNVLSLPVMEDGECASSVLTEEPGPDILEMDQLEAELESELQKLSCCSTEASCPERLTSDLCEETEVSGKGFHEQQEQKAGSYQFQGVLPCELDRKLSQVLIEQQESQIVELESKLHSAHSKLNEKEDELRALKDCVRRLTQFSLLTASDDEPEVHVEQEKNCSYDHKNKMTPESKTPVVGMKRAIDS